MIVKFPSRFSGWGVSPFKTNRKPCGLKTSGQGEFLE
jgi:hypothetical protein